jgi:hypothetical protein
MTFNFRAFSSILVGVILMFLSITSHAQTNSKNKSTSKPAAITAVSDDEKKFDVVKADNESVWTCENNIKVKTALNNNNYFLLWNKKMYVLSSVDALNGVSHYADIINKIDWLVIPGKAMLFDTKAGQRLLDYCKTPDMMKTTLTQDTDLMK